MELDNSNGLLVNAHLVVPTLTVAAEAIGKVGGAAELAKELGIKVWVAGLVWRMRGVVRKWWACNEWQGILSGLRVHRIICCL